MAKEVYELISLATRGRYPRRKLSRNRIGLFNNLPNAEKAMLKFIDDEKRYYEEPEDGVYENDYLGFEIGKYAINRSRILYYTPLYWTYDCHGNLNDYTMVDDKGQFKGRPAAKVHFQLGDLVEVAYNDYVEVAIIGKLPPSPEWFQKMLAGIDSKEAERVSWQWVAGDDCYVVYTLGEGDTHRHEPCYSVFGPTRKISRVLQKKLRAKLDKYDRGYMTKEETLAFATELFNREADKIDDMYK